MRHTEVITPTPKSPRQWRKSSHYPAWLLPNSIPLHLVHDAFHVLIPILHQSELTI